MEIKKSKRGFTPTDRSAHPSNLAGEFDKSDESGNLAILVNVTYLGEFACFCTIYICIIIISNIFGGCWTYKSGLRIFVWAPKVPLFCTQKWALLAKVLTFGYKKMGLQAPKSKNGDHFHKYNIPQ